MRGFESGEASWEVLGVGLCPWQVRSQGADSKSPGKWGT